MGLAALSVTHFLAVALVIGYIFREHGVPLPWTGGIRLDLWNTLIYDSPQSAYSIFLENMVTYIPLYSVAHILLYVEPQRSLFHPFKLNPRYPSNSLVIKEIFRSIRGVCILSLYEVVVNSLHRQGSLPSVYTPDIFKLGQDGAPPHIIGLVSVFLLSYLWGDAHFYWTHRLLHSPMLYRRVHKEHHESFNPDPFSGLSMHWVESSIYFSSALLTAPLFPLWAFRLLSLSLLVAPLQGHSGYGDWEDQGSPFHYIHHAKFNWNYGASPLWDNMMGTSYPGKPEDNTDRGKQAREQAEMVDCNLEDE